MYEKKKPSIDKIIYITDSLKGEEMSLSSEGLDKTTGNKNKSQEEISLEAKSKLQEGLKRFGLEKPTYEQYTEAVKSAKNKLKRQNSFMLPLPIAVPELITIGKYKIAQGLVKWESWRKEMINSIDERVRPLLKKVLD
jgi:hypothetical protein